MSRRSRRGRSLRAGREEWPWCASEYCSAAALSKGLHRSPRFPTMTGVGKKPAGGLRNTLYDQQTRSGRRLTRGRLLLYRILVPVALSLLRLVWSWSRVVRVIGAEHIAAAL